MYAGSNNGVYWHSDSVCTATWSAQIVGSKQWRLREPDGTELNGVLHAGDLLLFFPQRLHKTETLSVETLSLNGDLSFPTRNNVFIRSMMHSNKNAQSKYRKCFSQQSVLGQNKMYVSFSLFYLRPCHIVGLLWPGCVGNARSKSSIQPMSWPATVRS